MTRARTILIDRRLPAPRHTNVWGGEPPVRFFAPAPRFSLHPVSNGTLEITAMSMFPIVPGRAHDLTEDALAPAEAPIGRLPVTRRGMFGLAAGLAATTMLPASAIAGNPDANSGATRKNGEVRMSSGLSLIHI